jgi:protein CpxP
MNYSESIIKHLLLPGLLALSIPLAASAEPQFDEGAGHNGPDEKHFGHQHFGHQFNHEEHEGRGFRFPHELELSDSQRDKIFSIKHTQEALFYEQGKIVRKAHLDLHKLANSDQYDDEKAKAISDKLGKALATITFLKVQERHQIFSLLTPEQRNLLKSPHFGHDDGHSMHSSAAE